MLCRIILTCLEEWLTQSISPIKCLSLYLQEVRAQFSKIQCQVLYKYKWYIHITSRQVHRAIQLSYCLAKLRYLLTQKATVCEAHKQ